MSAVGGPSVERRFESEDARNSAAWLAFLMCGTSLIVLATSWTGMPLSMRPVFYGALGTGLASLAYLVAARRRTQPGIFAAVSLAQVLPLLIVFPYAAVQWSE